MRGTINNYCVIARCRLACCFRGCVISWFSEAVFK